MSQLPFPSQVYWFCPTVFFSDERIWYVGVEAWCIVGRNLSHIITYWLNGEECTNCSITRSHHLSTGRSDAFSIVLTVHHPVHWLASLNPLISPFLHDRCTLHVRCRGGGVRGSVCVVMMRRLPFLWRPSWAGICVSVCFLKVVFQQHIRRHNYPDWSLLSSFQVFYLVKCQIIFLQSRHWIVLGWLQ